MRNPTTEPMIITSIALGALLPVKPRSSVRDSALEVTAASRNQQNVKEG